jgi:hypothetical protein
MIHVVPAFRDPLTAEQAELLAGFLAAVASDPDLQLLTTVEQNPHCGVWLRDGRDVPCLAVAHCSLGHFSVLTRAGLVLQYFHSEVK